MRCRILQLALAAAMGPVYGCASLSFIATIITLGSDQPDTSPTTTNSRLCGSHKSPNKPL